MVLAFSRAHTHSLTHTPEKLALKAQPPPVERQGEQLYVSSQSGPYLCHFGADGNRRLRFSSPPSSERSDRREHVCQRHSSETQAEDRERDSC